MSVLIEHFAAATAALSAGRREGGVMTEAAGFGNARRHRRDGNHLNLAAFRAMVGLVKHVKQRSDPCFTSGP
jgi:hypothetical protein